MGMDLNWVAVSEDYDRLKALKSYILELEDRTDENEVWEDHKIMCYSMQVYEREGRYYLIGCWRKCWGYDLGYWMNKDGKNDLLENVKFFEERENDTFVYLCTKDESDESCMLAGIVEFGCIYDGLIDESVEENVEMWPYLREIISTGELHGGGEL